MQSTYRAHSCSSLLVLVHTPSPRLPTVTRIPTALHPRPKLLAPAPTSTTPADPQHHDAPSVPQPGAAPVARHQLLVLVPLPAPRPLVQALQGVRLPLLLLNGKLRASTEQGEAAAR